MSDFTLCTNTDCTLKHGCSRFTSVVKPDGWQSYAHFVPKDGKCEGFESNKKHERQTKT